MRTKSSKKPTAGGSALSSLYDSWNVTRRATSVGLIKPALDSTDDLLDTIRESKTSRQEYIGLEQSCVGVCEVLNQGTDRRPEDHLSQSGLEAIEELTATVDEIKRNIVKQGKRRAISRVLHSKKNKEAIVSWRLSLNKILCTLSSEFGSGEPVFTPDPRREAAEPHTAAPDVRPGNSNAETTSPTASHDISDSRTAASQIPTGVVNIHALDHETHRNTTEGIGGSCNPGRSTHVSIPDRSTPPLEDTCGMTPGVRTHIEKMHTTANTHKMINGMPQQINGGTGDRHQVAAESVSGESPPPPQRIFGRDELVKNIVDLVDADHPTPIALIGTGGIGKTSVALAVLHDDRIKQRFGGHRRLLRCDQFSASLPNFLRRLSEVIGAGIENPADLTSLRPFLSRNRMLLIIDNAEPIFGGPTTKDIDPVVEELSQFGNIWLCITSRTSIIPTRCKVIDVPTLSMEAARETFHSIYRRGEQSDAVDDILKQLDFHPLSIILLATAAKHNKWGIGQLEKEWGEQRTSVLRTRYHGSLAATIEFSLRSPMFRDLGPHARDLLGVVAFFPLGIDENNLDWLFPSIADRKKIFYCFSVLSLTHRNNGFIAMLAPLRDHLCPKDPNSASLLCSVKEHYFSRLSFSIRNLTPNDDRTTWIASEDVNVEHLLDIFTSIDANSESVWDACGHFMFHLFLHKPRLPVFSPKIGALPDDYPLKPECLSNLSYLRIVTGNPAERRRLLCRALKLHRERGNGPELAFTLWQLATINSSPDLCEEGIQQAREAMTIYQRLGDMMGVARCHAELSRLFRCANRLDDAEASESEAIGLIDTLMPIADPTSRGFLHGFLYTVYSGRGDTEKAVFHTEAALGAIPARSGRVHMHCKLATIHIEEGKLDDAEAHLEYAGSLAANGSSEPCSVVFLRAYLLWEQGKFEEARSEALRARDLAEEFWGGDKAEAVKHFFHAIDERAVEYASMGELLPSIARRTKSTILAALGGDTSQHEKIRKATKKIMALLDHPRPTFFQIATAYEELWTLIGNLVNEKESEAIGESLAISTAVDESDEMPPPDPLMCRDNGPVVIWTTDPKLAHIGKLWQALYHVPQVRHRISQYRSPHPLEGNTNVDVDPLSGGTGGHVSSAHEVFRHMELSGLRVVMVELSMERFPHRPWEDIFPCEDVEEAYKEISEQVETGLNDGLAKRHPDWPRLFYSRINDATSRGHWAFDAKKDFSLISLGYNDGDESSDLIGCLIDQLFPEFPEQRTLGKNHTTTGGCATIKPADVIAFALARDGSPPSPTAGRSRRRRKFSFPESFRWDQFITTSRSRVQNANTAERDILRETRSDLARVGKKYFTGSLLSSLHYYENVARSPTDVERHATIKSSAAKLKDVIAHINAEWNAIGTTVERLEKESHTPSSSKQAHQNKYDLRAVLMHDGQNGREHVYSYISHEGAWWKVVDCTVTKVRLGFRWTLTQIGPTDGSHPQVALETVLSDENGMDVGAGPFFLIYSRSLSGPLKSEWPKTLENAYNPNSAPSGSNSRTPTEGS